MFPFNIVIGALRFVLLASIGLLLALGLWGATPGSLGVTLGLLKPLLPAGQKLEISDVSGSLRAGGHIGALQWTQDGLNVQARDATITWDWLALLNGKLRLTQLEVAHLQIHDQRPPSPIVVPTDLSLPIKVETPFRIGTLIWEGTPRTRIDDLSGQYVFDSNKHRIDAGSVRFSSGNYQFSGQVDARDAMALLLQLDGTVQASIPGSTQTLTLVAHASINGALAGHDARLDVQARVAPQGEAVSATPPSPAPSPPVRSGKPTGKPPAAASPPKLASMQASATAEVQPWQPQPLAQAEAQWQSLNLALLWPDAPQTLLDGSAKVEPVPAGGWRAEISLRNELAGRWDAQRLPVEQLTATATHDGRQWRIDALRASAAGGQVNAQGKVLDADGVWQATATFSGIDTARIHSRLDAGVLNGKLDARKVGEGVAFDLKMQPVAGKGASAKQPLAGLPIQSAHVQGTWSPARLNLPVLSVKTDDAQLAGTLDTDLKTFATNTRLTLNFPGGDAALAGNLAPATGQGTLRLHMADAAKASRWMARWPVVGPALKGTRLAGAADLTGSWQGGWQQQGGALQLQATLAVPELDVIPSGPVSTPTWKVRDAHIEVNGSLSALQLTARSRANDGTRHLQVQLEATGGRTTDGGWQARVGLAKLDVRDSRVAGTWTAQLEQAVTAAWRPAPAAQALLTSAGAVALTGPEKGKVRLAWQTITGTRDAAGVLNWQSKGRMDALPLAWLAVLSDNPGGNLNLRGDLMLGGQWDIAFGSDLRLRASIERTSGDLYLQTEDDGGTQLASGVREARLNLKIDNEALAASLVWDSERGGDLKATATSRLTRQQGQWSWASDAPVEGKLTARLPRIGGWSVLAPPGWRLRGTLDANAALAGTRAKPQWSGDLKADELAVRSVVDGIDFSKGSLRATLKDQRVSIDAFSIHGAGSGQGDGGELSATGFALWPPLDVESGVKDVQMELDVKVSHLRVSTRSDLRLAVSGDLTARLKDAKFILRGTLTADSALFVLPEDTTPTLGDDVVVRRKVTGGTRAASFSNTATQTERVTPDVSITLDLGPDFRVRGHGISTRLEGRLVLTHETRGTLVPRLTGQIQTMQGTYKAYGQQLSIEQGVLRFSGPYDNPALEIRAIRPNSTQRVGVEITGTVLSPRVRLFSDPEMPDAEKLSWLLLGRGSASGGADSALLQQAAMALLGRNGKNPATDLTETFGLDELSVNGETNNADGTTSAATFRLGKRISKDFYVAYEQSLSGTLGSFSIFYDLTRYLTLRARTGENASVDLIFTIRYD